MTPVTEYVVEPAVLAAVAARTALTVPGVLRLEPGVRGMVSTWMRTGRQRFGGVRPLPADGVRVRNHADGRITVEVDVVLSTERPASEIGIAVQREIARVLADSIGQRVAAVTVSILEIEVPG